jgi:hypothetical protein
MAATTGLLLEMAYKTSASLEVVRTKFAALEEALFEHDFPRYDDQIKYMARRLKWGFEGRRRGRPL